MKKLKIELEESTSTIQLSILREKILKNIGKANFLFIGTIEKENC